MNAQPNETKIQIFAKADASMHDDNTSRLFSLDAVRGLIIVLMALDHANHFVAHQHSSGEYWGGPPLPVYNSILAFFTRFVTHPAAPGFFFLMGAGILLFADSRQKQGWSKLAIVRHFLIRGGLLMALQLLVANRAWELHPGGFSGFYIGVLFALGGSMIIGSLLLWLKPKLLGILTVALFLGMAYQIQTLVGMNWLNLAWELPNLMLTYPGGPMDGSVWSNYPILPWLGLVLFGIIFGYWLVKNRKRAFNRALKLGIGFVIVFLMIRLINWQYSSFFYFSIRPVPINNWIDFLNVVKYPPSITFTLMTMGILLILLNLMSRSGEKMKRILQPLIVFGRVPLFFYVGHLFLYAIIGLLLTPNGTSILLMYPLWILGLVILYPLCLWYGHLKKRHPNNVILRFL